MRWACAARVLGRMLALPTRLVERLDRNRDSALPGT